MNQISSTVKSPIKDTLKEDKPPNKGQAEVLMYTHSIEICLWKRTISLQRTKWLVPKVSLLRGYTVHATIVPNRRGGGLAFWVLSSQGSKSKGGSH